jgi:hypothetical protein
MRAFSIRFGWLTPGALSSRKPRSQRTSPFTFELCESEEGSGARKPRGNAKKIEPRKAEKGKKKAYFLADLLQQ